MSPKTVPHLLQSAQDQRVRPDMTATLAGPLEPLHVTVKGRKLTWFGHVTRHDFLCKIVLLCTLDGGRR
ncbi:hypothetical protein DPMN_132512 [Dreissena polymorpha]|uniref:Uncharacterized protein n=1 Tax=Dreissena polymorpha TaxID=45954 RepID=A0A9D4JA66_DREPO|nr:hypothetical protein DPMN_132512 [Dreissena polymorpha]